MSFADVGTEWYSRPKSILNGRADLIQHPGPVCDDPFLDDATPCWRRCALSHAALEGPVVCDAKGNLMLKEELLVALLKKRVPPHLRHVSSMKQVFECNLKRKDGLALCPVTGDELRLGARVWRPCGCVVSQAAVDLGPEKVCGSCGQSIESHVDLGEIQRVKRQKI